jgi:hypothetical protein
MVTLVSANKTRRSHDRAGFDSFTSESFPDSEEGGGGGFVPAQ